MATTSRIKARRQYREFKIYVNDQMTTATDPTSTYVDPAGEVRHVSDHPHYEICLRLFRRCLLTEGLVPDDWMVSFTNFQNAFRNEMGEEHPPGFPRIHFTDPNGPVSGNMEWASYPVLVDDEGTPDQIVYGNLDVRTREPTVHVEASVSESSHYGLA